MRWQKRNFYQKIVRLSLKCQKWGKWSKKSLLQYVFCSLISWLSRHREFSWYPKTKHILASKYSREARASFFPLNWLDSPSDVPISTPTFSSSLWQNTPRYKIVNLFIRFQLEQPRSLKAKFFVCQSVPNLYRCVQ